MQNEELKQKRAQIWEEYLESVRNDAQRKKEIEEQKMPFGEVVMKYGIQVFGEPDENGYPLYIALHGGGQGDKPDFNDSQWQHMGIYYARSVKHGVYVNTRGVRDTWDTHANPESYPLYDRLIENMVAFYQVDPNRVYICGFSAGGDGVYLVGPRMADRFAAMNMSAGHHNYTSILNLRNTPIRLQVGMNDGAYNRNVVTVEYMDLLNKLSYTYGGYVHDGFVHKDRGHNFKDWAEEEQLVLANPQKWVVDGSSEGRLADTNVIRFLNRHRRNALPEKIVWDLGNRAPQRSVESFFWLRASKEVEEGIIIVRIEKETNRIVVEQNTTGKNFEVLYNEEMLDLSKPVEIVGADGETRVVETEISWDLLRETTYERGDWNYQFVASVVC